MKTPLLSFALAGIVWLGTAASLRAEDWKTTDGKVYQDVKVVRTEPDAVTILHHTGGGRIPLANLPPELQQRFHYDPAQAKLAAAQRARETVANNQALQAEMNLAAAQRQPGGVPAENNDAGDTLVSPSPETFLHQPSPAPRDPSHHSMAELSSSLHTLKFDLSDASHHSIDEMTTAAAAMRRDLADPDYHTMAHLAFTIHSLSADPDANHHTIDELTNLGL